MSTIVVTGAVGGVGSWTVEGLAADGHRVVAIDRERPDGGRENVDFYAADLTDQGETWELIMDADPDYVVHFAAIPDPTGDPGRVVFENNVTSTYNVLDAAGRVGADVVWASSESAYGFPFAAELPLPERLPITEEHPLEPEDPYGTSKVAGEEVAKAIARRDGIRVASLRLSWVQYPGRYHAGGDPGVERGTPMTGNYWTYIDVRDVVEAVRAAMDADFEGEEAFNVHADENATGTDTVELFERAFGDVPEPCDVEGEECPFSTAKAKEMLGWEPAHDWRSVEGESEEAPSFVSP